MNNRLEQHRAVRDIPKAKLAYEKSRIIDNLIENELIFETAEKESIEISDRRIVNQLHDAMTMFFKKTEDDDKKVAETVERVSKNLEKLMGDRFNPDIKIDPDLKKFMAFVEKKEKIDFFCLLRPDKNRDCKAADNVHIDRRQPSVLRGRKEMVQQKQGETGTGGAC